MTFKCRLRFSVFILSLFYSTFISAQLCVGSLGDPVVNINFGSGSNYGPSLSPSITNYSYEGNGCPNDGLYVISNSLTSCFSGSWHVLTEDHTPGDSSGYMMVVNASYNKGEFYVQKVDGLCAGTSYQLAAWIINVQKANTCGANPIKPKVSFQVETLSGTVLANSSTDEIASDGAPVWKQYGTFFTVPQGETSVIIRLINDAPGGCGNDLALDDITFSPCGPKITSGINGNSTTFDYCIGQTPVTALSASIVGGTNVFYQWQSSADKGITWKDIPGATFAGYTPLPILVAGTYLYRLSASQSSDISSITCRVVSNPLTINVNPLPVPAPTSNSPVCEDADLILSANKNGIQYLWTGPLNYSGNNHTTTIKSVDTTNSGKYYLTMISDKGCTARDSIMTIVFQKPDIIVTDPPAFCEGDSMMINASGNNLTGWKWAPSTSLSSDIIANPIAFPDSTRTYYVTASNNTCSTTDSVKVIIFNKPVANAGPDKISFIGNSAMLTAVAGGTNVSLSWTPAIYLDQPSIATPVTTSPVDITYTLTVTSNQGCGTSSDNVFVKVYAKTVPNAFSPNNDGINDTWKIPFLELYPDAVVNVFNRYGQLVYATSGAYKPWDGAHNGKLLPVGTYYYIVTSTSTKLKYSGSVLIIR